MVAHASTLEGVQDQPGQHSKILSLQKMKIKKLITQAWRHMPVLSATQEAEVRGSLEPKISRLQQAVVIALHSSRRKRETLSL